MTYLFKCVPHISYRHCHIWPCFHIVFVVGYAYPSLMERIMFSLHSLKSKLYRAQLSLHLKETLLLLSKRSHQYNTNINNFNYKFRITKLQDIYIYIYIHIHMQQKQSKLSVLYLEQIYALR